MPSEYPLNPQKLREYNITKFKGIPPTWEMIEKVIKKSGLKFQTRFEMVWGISHKILTQVKRGDKKLPCAYWHIFYDFDTIRVETKKKIEQKKEVAQKKSYIPITNKKLLDDFKTRQPAG